MTLSDLALPPEGAVLQSAVLTTFDLDLSALSPLPADPASAEQCLVFYGDGRFQDGPVDDPRRDRYRGMLIPAVFPAAEDGWPPAHAHGKIWLFEFANSSGERLYRLSVHSMNLYPDDNLENQVVFSGRETGVPQPKTEALTAYLSLLKNFVTENVPGREAKLSLLGRLIPALSTVRFEPLEAWSCEDYELIGPGMNRAAFLCEPCDELLIICQRIQRGGLSMILHAAGRAAKSITVSNLSTIQELLAGGPVRTLLLPQSDSRKYIHAKIFLMRRGGQWDLFCGSMNLTAFAVSRNQEFMVHLKNPVFLRSTESFLAGFLGVPESGIRQQLRNPAFSERPEAPPGPEEPKTPEIINSPVFRTAASWPARYRVLHRFLNKPGYSPADRDRMTAYVLSPACGQDLARLAAADGLPSVPELIIRQVGCKSREIYLLPLRERLLLALVNQAMHRYDGCFSPHLYSHIRGREPVYSLTRIRETPDFGSLYLFRTDVRNFGAGMDPEVLSQAIRTLPGIDPVFCSFVDRLLARRTYSRGGTLHADGPAVQPGNALCGFFENVCLRELDERMENRAAFYARCADDILIGARTREDLAGLADEVRRIMADRKLQLQESKTKMLQPGAPFAWLGWQVSGSRIDFRPEELNALRRRLHRETGRLIRECGKRDIPPFLRPMMIIPYVNKVISRLGLAEAFRVVSVPNGLREIDRMLTDMIRAVISGKTGNAKYRVSWRDIRKWGYQPLVTRWYRHISGKNREAHS